MVTIYQGDENVIVPHPVEVIDPDCEPVPASFYSPPTSSIQLGALSEYHITLGQVAPATAIPSAEKDMSIKIDDEIICSTERQK